MEPQITQITQIKKKFFAKKKVQKKQGHTNVQGWIFTWEKGAILAEKEIQAGSCFVNTFVRSDPR
jgi:hypothetical protein